MKKDFSRFVFCFPTIIVVAFYFTTIMIVASLKEGISEV